ncbi:MAG: PSD1 and planctomycete cytochrome C domain-containing protein, partial [Planctomycetes bacterium]|nr:PSD1 and planctomycete cytochrome C domain-containing protein [Planctomycetota bacterium]
MTESFELRWLATLSFLFLGLTPATAADKANPAAVEFFEKKIRPILVESCYTCHSADTKPSGNLRVDDRNGLLTGGNAGPAVVPGDPQKSLLIKRVTQKDKRKMPLEGKGLTDEQVADLTKWIADGAAWPSLEANIAVGKPNPNYDKLRKEHWAWQQLKDTKSPKVQNEAWAHDAIDKFILAKLESRGLKPVGDADKVTLIRRVTFDLTGLPPTPGQIDDFVKDSSADAFEKVVDRLLTSPQFGERWGRHWLDLARYGESTGPSRNVPYPHAWKYRDYVVDSVNADIPFDRFVREQIAGDLLPTESKSERDRLLTATGFLALGPKDVNQRFKVRFVMDNVDEQIDAVARSVLGLTVSCARCHDHKFDPIPQADYYALAGIFTSTDHCAGVRNKMGGGGLDYYDPSMLLRLSTGDVPQAPSEKLEKLRIEVAKAKTEYDASRGTPEGKALAPNGFPTMREYRLKYEKLQGELAALTETADVVHGVREAQKIADTEIRIRGEAEKLGPVVPRGFLSNFEVPGSAKVNTAQSGRLELAQWLTSAKNPLTSRVIVNRIWQHLFGQGIVSTVDNFGVMGDVPSHPELLDHLAGRFIQDGWSMKKMIRTIVLTRAYQLGSEATEEYRKLDPANRLVWRHSPRRLDAEEIRDASLAAAGKLDLKRPAGSPAKELKMVEMRDNGPEAGKINDHSDKSTYRSLYLPSLRGVTPHALEAFDPVEQTLVTGSRDTTTVPSQALFLLNSSFVRRLSLDLAERLLAETNATDAERIQRVYRLTVGRSASDKDVERAVAFLNEYETIYRKESANLPPPKAKPKPIAPKKAVAPPANPDDLEQTGEEIVLDEIYPKDARTAA